MEFEQNWVIVKPETFFPCRTPVLICDTNGNINIASFIPPEGSRKEGYWQCYANLVGVTGTPHDCCGLKTQGEVKYWQKIYIPKEFNKKKIYSIIAYSPDKKQIYPFVFTDWKMAKAKEKEMMNLNYKVNFEEKEI